ncbi:MAG TPA: EAL domain-containing protein [Stellaceae bacterium]|nr:EAL domain-containing protein [Stellaceae bacterium]
MSLSIEVELPPSDWVVQFVEDIPTAIAVFDHELRYVAANSPWIDIFRLSAAPLAGQRHDELDPCAGPRLRRLQRRALAGEVVNGGTTIKIDDGKRLCDRAISMHPRRDPDGAISGVIAALHEISAAPRKQAAPDIADGLTGIAGRDQFLARLRATLPTDGTACPSIPMFLLDIDDFKSVNDLYGARVGDQVLKAIAARLLTAVRSRATTAERADGNGRPAEADLVARLGADEFAVMLDAAAPTLAAAEAFARRLLGLVEAPVIIDERQIRLTANVGFIITGAAQRTEDDVLRDLDIALQEAKLRGPSGVKAWEPALATTVGRRLVLLDQLRRALDEGQFVLHYQPILSLDDERIVGAEALLRWNHPSDGLVSPADFLPLLEESGLIVPVGCWVIREVARQMQVWQMLYGRDMLDWVAVNVSARQFNDPSLLLATLSEINDSGFPLDRLKLEITESAVMRNPEVTRAVLGDLQELGIRVALDDFGTGYSALGALRHYNVDTIKIDRDFTSRLDTEDGRALALALLQIARIYGAAVVAEGVETAEQHEIWRTAGCDFGQGYLFARPMDGSFFGAYALTHLVDDVAVG